MPAWAFLALAFALSWLPLVLAAWPSQLGLWLAQPLLVIGWARLRGDRDRQLPVADDALALLLLWGMAAALLALVAAWPLETLIESGALLPALGLSLCVGVVLLALWRLWPSFALAAHSGGRFARLLAVSGATGPADFRRGLAITGLVFALLAFGLSLAWPGW